MRESLDDLSGPKAITDVTLLAAEAGRRGNGDGREGQSQESKVLNAGIADGGGCEASNAWALCIWERKPRKSDGGERVLGLRTPSTLDSKIVAGVSCL